MQHSLSRFKPYLRWIIFGATIVFVLHALFQNWREVLNLRIEPAGLALLAIALGITLLAHIWTGWVWSAILRELNQPAKGSWGILVYLKTNISKYLPGNVWHFYGRVKASQKAGFPVGAATLSVFLEPLLMAAAALAIALIGVTENRLLQLLALVGILAIVHPKVLNPLLSLAQRLKGQAQVTEESEHLMPVSANALPNQPNPVAMPLQIRRYPWLPLLGEFAFVLLRGVGFLLTISVLSPILTSHIPITLGAFSFAWLLGLVIPGAPGGIGVFEATAIALLKTQFPTATILGGVALYRLVSLLAEASGAGLAHWAEQMDAGFVDE
jgi:glycosyltransferase 2 family protein